MQEANGKSRLLSYFLGNCICLPFLIYLRSVRCVREMGRHSLSLRPIALVHVFISVGSGQSQASYHPRRILSPCLPLMPRNSNNPTCTRLHSHINSHTHLLKTSPQHTHSYIPIHIHTHVPTRTAHTHTLGHKQVSAHTRTHSGMLTHAHTLTHLNTHLHTHFLCMHT